MSNSDRDPLDDDVAQALLDGSTYERLRFERSSFFSGSIPRKLQLQSTLLFVLAAILPIMEALPSTVLEEAGTASPKVILLGFIGGAVVFAGGVVLTLVAVARLRLQGGMSEYRAEQLLSLEEVASLLGFITGGVPILLTLGYVLLGHGGRRAVESYVRTIGASPFASSGAATVGINVATVATSAFVGAVALFVFSQALHMELRLRLDGRGASPE